jgi:hypothetical protein
MPISRWTAAVLGGVILASAACNDGKSATDLNPEGPPMVRQVFVQEKVTTGTTVRERLQLAFGDHPEIPLLDEDAAFGDDREVLNAVALGTSRLRVVFDELVVGNAIEEIACADGTWSIVPPGTTPDDLKDCAGPPESLTRCTKVCITGSGPVGILDANQDGAVDDTRMRGYDGDQLAVSVVCGGVSIPLDRENSYYNPSGNQLLPAVAPPSNIMGLGPAVMLVPSQGLRTSSECTVTFRPEVTDKDGNQVCAPPGGDVTASCTPGDTKAITFNSEPLALFRSQPGDGDVGVPLSLGTTGDAVISLQMVARIDPASVGAITLEEVGGAAVAIVPTVSVDDPSQVTVTVPGGYTAETEYVLTIGTGVTDIFGGAVPQDIVVTFTSGTGTAPEIDAGA